jgi:FdhE protein
MAKAGAPRHEPIPIGEVAAPPFARLPDPAVLFAQRAERFRVLAIGHELKPYLEFLAGLAAVQHAIQDGLAVPELPAADALALVHRHAMPPLDRGRFTADAACEAALGRLLAHARACEIPAPAKTALLQLCAADPGTLAVMMRAVLADAIPVETIAGHVFVAAALQVHFARLAAQLDAARLVPVGDGACPACGSPPVASMIVGWRGAHGARFCACSLCGTMWNYVRIKCTACGSTKGTSYREIEGGPGTPPSNRGTVKAETCGICRSYVKILHQHKDPLLDPVADDVASLGLDLLVREAGLRRAGVNPFLTGY